MTAVAVDEQRALKLDEHDPLPTLRSRFLVPRHEDGREIAYFAGNSLGLQPRSTRQLLEEELADWASLGVEGHLEARRPWVAYHDQLREPSARLVGARPTEVVVMNSLTVNLHLLMAGFYRPTPDRFRIVIEDSAFPSDSYAVRSQAAWHGIDPDRAVVRLRPQGGGSVLHTDDITDWLAANGGDVALVLLGAVNYYSGQYLDIPTITAAGHAVGAIVGWDLAHAAGNLPVRLHDWDVDWAAWCSYKYLNAGPGSAAAAFVHERHLADRSLPKLAGWWSTDPRTRFDMGPTVTPIDTADAWAVSNPPILAMAPVLASLRIFDEVGLASLREKSVRLTGYLESLLDEIGVQFITPRDPDRRGAQLSVRLSADAAAVSAALRREHAVIADSRKPDVLRLAPAPLYNTFHDCWRAASALAAVLGG
jgi:kynureninase